MGDRGERSQSRSFSVGTAAALAALTAVSSALPDWVPDWRRRWPVQGALVGLATTVIALRPETVSPGRLPDSPAGAGADQTAGDDPEDESSLPSTAQGLDEPDIPWQQVLLPGVVLLAAGAAGGLWLERQLIEAVARRGVSRPRTAIALASLPLAYLQLRSERLPTDALDA